MPLPTRIGTASCSVGLCGLVAALWIDEPPSYPVLSGSALKSGRIQQVHQGSVEGAFASSFVTERDVQLLCILPQK